MKQKRRIILLVLIVSLIIIALTTVILFIYSEEKAKSPSTIISKANTTIEGSTGQKTPKPIAGILSKLSQTNLSEKNKYTELLKIRDYLSFVYTDSNNPEVRNFIKNDLNKYAQKNFPKSYKSSDFNIVCADPECGEPPDPGMEELIKEVNTIEMPEIYRDTINYNLKLATNLSDKYMSEKKSGFNLAIKQLNELDTEEASESALKIKEFFEIKYKTKL